MKTSSIAVETSRSISQSDSIVRQTNKRSFLSDTTMNNIHIFNDKVRNPTTDFSLISENKPQSSLTSFISASLKAIVTVELAAQNAGQIITLKCYANIFVKVDAKIGEECQHTTSYDA